MSDEPRDDLSSIEERLAALEEGKAAFDQNLQMNQCPGCGAYRIDGQPPRIHEHGCRFDDRPVPPAALPSWWKATSGASGETEGEG